MKTKNNLDAMTERQSLTHEPSGLTLRGPYYVCLVYQVGIANVFVSNEETGPRQRVFQGSFRDAEWLCRGARLAGALVSVFHCDKAGDVAQQDWTIGQGSLFEEGKHWPYRWE